MVQRGGGAAGSQALCSRSRRYTCAQPLPVVQRGSARRAAQRGALGLLGRVVLYRVRHARWSVASWPSISWAGSHFFKSRKSDWLRSRRSAKVHTYWPLCFELSPFVLF